MNWFKLYAEFATDPKVQSMTETMQRRLIMLFCLECSGDLPKLEDHELCLAMRISAAELEQTRKLFTRKGFVNGTWSPKNWDKRQQPTDPNAAERMRTLRERRRQEAEQLRNGDAERSPNVRVTEPECSPDVPRACATGGRSRELDLERELEKDVRTSDEPSPARSTRTHARRAANPFPKQPATADDPALLRIAAEEERRRNGDC